MLVSVLLIGFYTVCAKRKKKYIKTFRHTDNHKREKNTSENQITSLICVKLLNE